MDYNHLVEQQSAWIVVSKKMKILYGHINDNLSDFSFSGESDEEQIRISYF